MLTLFILKSNIRGMRYGIGTYLKQLTGALLNYGDINILMINYLSTKDREVTINSKIPRVTEIQIPMPLFADLKEERQYQKYANRVVDFLTPFLQKSPNPVFLVNYLDALPIVKHLKSRFSSIVLSVIHTAHWQFAFDGNKRKFNEAWINESGSNDMLMKPLKLEKELYEISDMVVSVTKYMKEFIVHYYNIPEEKVKIIHNGIDNYKFHNSSDSYKESLKRSLGFEINEKIVLFSGRLDKSKGLYFLLDAFAEVIKQFENVRLVLVGEDSGQNKISQYLSHCSNIWGKVTFTGFVETEVMNKFYQIADIGIIPSLYDHCPYVALEMIKNNVPLIISNTEGLNEILTKYQCIYLNPIIDNEGNLGFDKTEIAYSILTLLSNIKTKTHNLTSNYQNLIETRFSGERMGKEMYSILSKLQTK